MIEYTHVSIRVGYIWPVSKVRGENINKPFSSNPIHQGRIPMGRIYMCDWQRVGTPVGNNRVIILLVRIVLGMGCTYHNKSLRGKRESTLPVRVLGM